jgi:hypothetical protein
MYLYFILFQVSDALSWHSRNESACGTRHGMKYTSDDDRVTFWMFVSWDLGITEPCAHTLVCNSETNRTSQHVRTGLTITPGQLRMQVSILWWSSLWKHSSLVLYILRFRRITYCRINITHTSIVHACITGVINLSSDLGPHSFFVIDSRVARL